MWKLVDNKNELLELSNLTIFKKTRGYGFFLNTNNDIVDLKNLSLLKQIKELKLEVWHFDIYPKELCKLKNLEKL